MKLSTFFCMIVALINVFTAQAYVLSGAATGGSSFVVTRARVAAQVPAVVAAPSQLQQQRRRPGMFMGSQAKFGIFSPAVYVAKIVLGTDKLNKIRGKAISLHSEKITQFCEFFGAYHLRTKVIKKAKTNGDILGFLV
ncbi:hypothetical protein ACA910_021307 [Epithemia clementina (nom. ined.)]